MYILPVGVKRGSRCPDVGEKQVDSLAFVSRYAAALNRNSSSVLGCMLIIMPILVSTRWHELIPDAYFE
jgi:hypothetical protein